jgi:hypothetical protein
MRISFLAMAAAERPLGYESTPRIMVLADEAPGILARCEDDCAPGRH